MGNGRSVIADLRVQLFQADRGVDVASLTNELDRSTGVSRAELGAHAAAHELVVVDENDADGAHEDTRATVSATSVPVGPLRTTPVPP